MSTATALMPRVKTETVKITPRLAEEWLGRNSHNRALRNHVVEQLAGAMTRGEWRMNGDSIRFAWDGPLLDGQHRLWAVVESGVTIESLVITGLPNDAQDTMDQGIKRTLGDVLRMRGAVDYTAIAAVTTLYWRRITGQVRNPSARPTVAQACVVFEANPELWEATKQGRKLTQHFRVPPSVASCCWYEFSNIDAEATDVFFEKVGSGIALANGDPILALRRFLEKMTVGAQQHASPLLTHALFIKAWNAWREGRQLATLTWRPAGINAEAFPEPL
jgi:hypothetical protein